MVWFGSPRLLAALALLQLHSLHGQPGGRVRQRAALMEILTVSYLIHNSLNKHANVNIRTIVQNYLGESLDRLRSEKHWYKLRENFPNKRPTCGQWKQKLVSEVLR